MTPRELIDKIIQAWKTRNDDIWATMQQELDASHKAQEAYRSMCQGAYDRALKEQADVLNQRDAIDDVPANRANRAYLQGAAHAYEKVQKGIEADGLSLGIRLQRSREDDL